MSKRDGDLPEEQHQGSVAPEDEGVTRFINRLWSRGEPPERVEVWQLFGKDKRDRGEMIFHEDFKQGAKMDPERCNKLANEIIEAAQNDIDATPKKHEGHYQIAVVDRNRRASPLTRRIGPFYPKRRATITRAGMPMDGNGDLDEEDVTLNSLALQRLKASNEEARYDKQRNDRVLGEGLLLMMTLLREERERTQQLMSSHMEFFHRLQDAEDRSAARTLMIAKEKFKFDLMKDGWRTGRNILNGFFGGGGDGGEGGDGGGDGGSAASGEAQPADAKKTHGQSRERSLAESFLHDCEEAGLSVKLFGDYKMVDGKITLITPGIFTPKQFAIFLGVSEGRLPREALDPLMPNSGKDVEISMTQIQEALQAGVTEGIASSLSEIRRIRLEANQKKNAAKSGDSPETNP